MKHYLLHASLSTTVCCSIGSPFLPFFTLLLIHVLLLNRPYGESGPWTNVFRAKEFPNIQTFTCWVLYSQTIKFDSFHNKMPHRHHRHNKNH
uniref:Uncharacterized protein n=1 Tax=Anguilla anguilla TaxID=7936 RepID=A0A0E9SD55_ANGAN